MHFAFSFSSSIMCYEKNYSNKTSILILIIRQYLQGSLECDFFEFDSLKEQYKAVSQGTWLHILRQISLLYILLDNDCNKPHPENAALSI